MSDTPRTDALISQLDKDNNVAAGFVWRQMMNHARQIERENTKLRSALIEIQSLFNGEADASCEPGEDRFRPNRAMQVDTIVDTVLAEVDRES